MKEREELQDLVGRHRRRGYGGSQGQRNLPTNQNKRNREWDDDMLSHGDEDR
jgi:hypothetical protein